MHSRVDNSAGKGREIIKLLEQAFALAEELDYGDTGYLIERALNEARSRQLQLAGRPD